MPRDIISVDRFDGIYSNADAADITENFASDSLDIDPHAPAGTLRGRASDVVLASDRGGISASEACVITSPNNTYDLLYKTGTDLTISQNFPVGTTQVILKSDIARPSFTPHNQGAYVGLGKDQDAQWVGYIDHNRFGQVPDKTEVHLTDAKVVLGHYIPFLYKSVYDGDFYGAEFQGDTLYHITSTGAVTTSAAGTFTSIQGICAAANANYIYVFDLNGTYGVIRYVAKADLTVSATCTLNAYSFNTNSNNNLTFSDIIATNSKLWLAAYNLSQDMDLSNFIDTTLPASQPKLLFTTPIFTTNVQQSVTDVTPQLISTSGNTGTGNWVDIAFRAQTSPFYTEAATNRNIKHTFHTSLVKLSTTQVGWLVQLGDSTYNDNSRYKSTSDEFRYWVAGGLKLNNSQSYVKVNNPMFIVAESATVPAISPIISYDISDQDTAIVNRSVGTTSTTTAGYIFSGCGKYIQIRYLASLPSVYVKPTLTEQKQTNNELVVGEGMATYCVGLTYQDEVALVAKYDSVNDSVTEIGSGSHVTLVPVDNGTSGGLTTNRSYFYAYCLVYSSLHVSPLSAYASVAKTTTNANKITVQFRSVDSLDPRITAIQIYRSSGPSGGRPDGYFRFLQSIPVTDNTFVPNATGYTYDVFDTNEDQVVQSYEAMSGISETLHDSSMRYGLSVAMNSCLFVGDCQHDTLSDANHMIFRSKPFRYSTFNWADEYVRIPEVPVALATFSGRLYAFGTVNAYRIDPDNLVIEEVLIGSGVVDRNCVLSTEFGIVFYNNTGIYLFDGRNTTNLGVPIQDKWQLRDTTINCAMGYNIGKDHLLIPYYQVSGATSTLYILAFTLSLKRWDLWSCPVTTGTPYLFNGPDNTFYISTTSGCYAIAYDTTSLKDWYWKSKRMTAGLDRQSKKFYRIKLKTNGVAPTVQYYTDAWHTGTEISGTNRKADDIQVILNGDQDGSVNEVSIILRAMEGKR